MKKYVIGAIVFAFVLVIGFFGFSLVKANINDRTILEEWRSWLPTEEKKEEIPNGDEEINFIPIIPDDEIGDIT